MASAGSQSGNRGGSQDGSPSSSGSGSRNGQRIRKPTMRITGSPSSSGSGSYDGAPSQSLAIEDGVLAIEPDGEARYGRSKSGKALHAPIVSKSGRFGGSQYCKSPKH